MTVSRPQPVHMDADHGVITKQPRQIVLSGVRMARGQQQFQSDHATFFLRRDNTVDHILAEGDVRSELRGRAPNSETRGRSDRAELFLAGTRNQLTTAILSGNVQLASQGAQNQGTQNGGADPAEAAAGRVTLHFAGSQMLQTVHAEDGVRLSQKTGPGRAVGGGGRRARYRNERSGDGLHRAETAVCWSEPRRADRRKS